MDGEEETVTWEHKPVEIPVGTEGFIRIFRDDGTWEDWPITVTESSDGCDDQT